MLLHPGPTVTINTNGVSIPSAGTTFNGYANWNLAGNYTETGAGTIVALGTLNTNAYNYTVPYLTIGLVAGSGTVNGGTSIITMSSVPGNGYALNVAGGTFNSANATVNIAAASASVILKPGETVNFLNFTATTGTNTLYANGATINNTVFKSNGSVAQATNFGNLTLQPHYTYTFQSGITQNITGTLTANGNPCNTIVLQSSSPGTQAILNYTGGQKQLLTHTLRTLR